MKYRNREMRKLYEVELYQGDPNDEDVETEIVTVVAWNTVDALRKCGRRHAAHQPTFKHFVSWDEPPRRIEDTSGPLDEVVEADFGLEDEDF